MESQFSQEDADRWALVPPESQELMLMATTSHSYREWMEEDEWEELLVQNPGTLPLSDFKP